MIARAELQRVRSAAIANDDRPGQRIHAGDFTGSVRRSTEAVRQLLLARPDAFTRGARPITPPFVGALPLEIAREAVEEVVTVTEEQIVAAMRLLLTRAKLYVEGSGAVATAALLAGRVRVPPGAAVVAIVSGGNVDLDRIPRG